MTCHLSKIYSFVDQPILLEIDFLFHVGIPETREPHDPGRPDRCEVIHVMGQRQKLRCSWIRGDQGIDFSASIRSYVADGPAFAVVGPWLAMIACSEEIEEDMLEAYYEKLEARA